MLPERRSAIVDGPAGPIEVRVRTGGNGPWIVLAPSLGRSASDFDDLADRCADAGYRSLAPEPRGIGASAPATGDVTLADLADDVASVIRSLADGSATVVGHAFGNRVVRMVAARHPDLVEAVVLLACGGLVPPAASASAALRAVFDPAVTGERHLDAVRHAFFAPGNDATVWIDGWHADVAAVQGAAAASAPVEEWWTAGRADVLVVQPADDVIALPANAHQLVRALEGRADLVTIADAGHALLPEQPAAVAAAVVTWLDERRRRAPRWKHESS